MRVLSDGARRLINEMKKLRLSLIFNEQGRARARARARASERANADTMAVGPRGPRPTSADLEISPLRVASRIYMRAAPDGAPLARATRANKKFRPYPCVPAVFSPGEGEPSYGCRNTAGARGGSRFSFFDRRS